MKLVPATRSTLDSLIALILRWNTTVNLVAENEALPTMLWRRHVVDSLAVSEVLPQGSAEVVDLGSGGGFPGLVCAIMAPARPFRLIEADRRKAAFLNEAVRALALQNVEVQCCRIEALPHASVSVVTARAVAPLDRLLRLVGPILTPEGVAVLPKGAKVDAELAAASVVWTMTAERFQNPADLSGTILRLSEIRPRAPGQDPANPDRRDRQPEGGCR